MTTGTDSSLAYLYATLSALEARVREAVNQRLAHDTAPDDRFRGLYISDDEVARLFARPAPWTVAPPPPSAPAAGVAGGVAEHGSDIRLRRLAAEFDLDDVDVALLLVAVAPDLDARFERLYGYLNDDVSRRRATIGLALEVCGLPAGAAHARARLAAGAPLVDRAVVAVEETDRPFLTRSLIVPDRVTSYLLGDDRLDPLVEPLVTEVAGADEAQQPTQRDPGDLWHVFQRPGTAGLSLAAGIFWRAGRAVLALDLERLEASADVRQVAAAAAREAVLASAGLVVSPVEALADRGPDAVRAFADLPCGVVMVGTKAWDPAWSRRVPLRIAPPSMTADERRQMWTTALGDDGAAVDVATALGSFWLSPEQARRAVTAARRQAVSEARSVEAADVQAGARAQNAAGLERLSRRVTPRMTWEDLVLPPEPRSQLRDLVNRARNRDVVLDEWEMGATASRGRGVTGVFAGESGTGKTMSVEVIAGDLGLDMYVIDLSSVVDKYIGETEKNLDRIFTEADRVNGVLLFDEADALFGKRSEVSDARDRYANVEVAYLLQRMEQFDGVAVLTTNLRANLDEAFTRRLDAIIDFPQPEEEHRLLLWQRNLKPSVPQSDDIDLPFLARSFSLSGGDIRNIAVTAAYLAANQNRPVTMADLIRATEAEYRKLGRICVEAEFGSYFHLLGQFDVPEVVAGNGAAGDDGHIPDRATQPAPEDLDPAVDGHGRWPGLEQGARHATQRVRSRR